MPQDATASFGLLTRKDRTALDLPVWVGSTDQPASDGATFQRGSYVLDDRTGRLLDVYRDTYPVKLVGG